MIDKDAGAPVVGTGDATSSRSARGGAMQVLLSGKDDGLDPVTGLELAEDSVYVGFHRRSREEQLIADFLVGQPAADAYQDFQLARTEAFQPLFTMRIGAVRLTRGDERVDESASDSRLDHGLALGHHPHGADESLGSGALKQESTRAGLQAAKRVSIQIESREHDNSRLVGGVRDQASSLDTSHARHAYIHQHDVGR